MVSDRKDLLCMERDMKQQDGRDLYQWYSKETAGLEAWHWWCGSPCFDWNEI